MANVTEQNDLYATKVGPLAVIYRIERSINTRRAGLGLMLFYDGVSIYDQDHPK